MGIDYKAVYVLPTPEEERERKAMRLRQKWGQPRQPVVVIDTVIPDTPLPSRDTALARYDALLASGLHPVMCRWQVVDELGVKERTLRAWLQHRQDVPKSAPPKPTGRIPAVGFRPDKAGALARYDALLAKYPQMSRTEVRRQTAAEYGISDKTFATWLRDRAKAVQS